MHVAVAIGVAKMPIGRRRFLRLVGVAWPSFMPIISGDVVASSCRTANALVVLTRCGRYMPSLAAKAILSLLRFHFTSMHVVGFTHHLL